MSMLCEITYTWQEGGENYVVKGGHHHFLLLISRNFSKTKSARWKVKVKFNLEQATKAQRRSRGVTLLFP
jgi:hypothetical protein